MTYTYYRRYQPSKKRSGFKSFFWFVAILVILLILLKACVSFVGSLWEEKKDEASLVINKGSAQILEWGQTDATVASDAQVVLVGDTITTGEASLATLSFYDGTLVNLDENTKVLFEKATLDMPLTAGAANGGGETVDQIELVLVSGKAFVASASESDGSMNLILKTDVSNVSSMLGKYLVANSAEQEYVYAALGPVTVNFVDRSQEDALIQSLELSAGQQTLLTSDDRINLIGRESVISAEAVTEPTDSFLKLSLGEEIAPNPDEAVTDLGTTVDEEVVTDTTTTDDTTVDDTTTTDDTSILQIRVDSPSSPITIQKDAIAIEGTIEVGTGNTVTVTWDGNNQAYTLGGYAPGDTNFRYVADADYGNLKLGQNVYTVIAYDVAGNVSNTVTITITAEF